MMRGGPHLIAIEKEVAGGYVERARRRIGQTGLLNSVTANIPKRIVTDRQNDWLTCRAAWDATSNALR